MQKRIRDYGIKIGRLETGALNKITDVKGVTVGHSTINEGSLKTGVTAIHPHEGNIFKNKVVGATYVMNGFGKTIGTVQVEELGTIETPILLTNTLSVGECTNSLLSYMVEQNEEIGDTTGTVNPIVCECNDMFINDIRAFGVKKDHVYEAIHTAGVDFLEGSVGAGTGMKCFGLKGGIGSSSRVVSYPHGTYTIGALVLSNFGELQNLTIDGGHVGKKIKEKLSNQSNEGDKGSIIMVIATDLPVTARQLKRIIKRAGVGLSRTGSYLGNGSGDIIIGFSTINKINHESKDELVTVSAIHENDIDQAFMAAADATEEAILNSMITADTTIARNGSTVYSLKEFINDL